MTEHDEELHFGEGETFTIGLEEELFLVDPADGHLVNTGAEVIEQIGELSRGEIKNELHRSQIELITGVCKTAQEAVAELCELRRAVLATGTGIVACGTPPTAVIEFAPKADEAPRPRAEPGPQADRHSSRKPGGLPIDVNAVITKALKAAGLMRS